jgi:hypothetical protein
MVFKFLVMYCREESKIWSFARFYENAKKSACGFFTTVLKTLKVHKIENFFGSDFEFCTISLLVLLKY